MVLRMGGGGGVDREIPLKVRNIDIWVKLRQVGVDLEHQIRFSESKMKRTELTVPVNTLVV